ncbi:hypothetical protein FRC07_014661 [Ceratobasidium sp. 392]|nr:hypothetical protein FRC07_014661 [Ceratobasidium sp. 392]
MAPNKPSSTRSSRPTREIKVPLHAKQSAAALNAARESHKKSEEKKKLLQRRTQQAELVAQALVQARQNVRHHTSEPTDLNTETQVNDDSPSTANATVNASITHDPILQGVLEEERERNDLIDWLSRHHPGRDFSTLDTDELKNLRAEYGPGPTIQPDHNPYPSVRIEPRLSTASQQSNRKCSQRDTQSRNAPHTVGIGADLDASFDQPQARLKATALPARPVPRQSETASLTHSRPMSGTRHLGNRQDGPHSQHTLSQPRSTIPDAPIMVSSLTDRRVNIPNPPQTPNSRPLPRRPTRPSKQPKPMRPTSVSNSPQLSRARARLNIAHSPRALRQTTAMGQELDQANFEPVTHTVSDRIRDPIPGGKPRRTEWHGVTRQLVDRTAADAKASLIAAGYMKTAEERELIVLQAWGRANEYLKRPRPFQPMTKRQVRYIADIIEEHSSGIHISKATRVEILRPHFNTYLSSLNNLREANPGRLSNLLSRLHDGCITLSGVFDEVPINGANNVIAVEQFDTTPVEPYQPRYAARQMEALMARANIIDEDDIDMARDEDEIDMARDEDEINTVRGEDDTNMDWEGGDMDMERNNSDYGEPGPGPSTLRSRHAGALGGDGFRWGDYSHDIEDEDGSGSEM